MKFTEKDIRTFRTISLVSGIFTVVVAITILFSFIQLKTMDPVNSPVLQTLKDQYDSDPDNRDKAEQIRTLDLMARKAYFTSRWQVETGSYILLAGAIVFVVFQRLVAGSEKPSRSLLKSRPDIEAEKSAGRRFLLISAGVVTLLAVVSSFVLRNNFTPLVKSATVAEGNEPSGSPAGIITPGEVNWPFFRGEGSRGIAGGTGYPTVWNGSDGSNIKWKMVVPKPGKNSPVIWGSRLFITGASGSECDVYCINKKTGEILWTGSGSGFTGATSAVPESDAEAGMAVPTAAVADNVVCAIFGNGNLVCFDHDGNLKWGKNIGVPSGTYGYSSSLVIYDNLLIVQYDSQDKLSISGYDLVSGKLKWETARTGRPVNSSPVIAYFDRQPQVLVNGNPDISAYDPVSGKELWSLQGVSGDVAPSLAVNSSMVFAAQDYYSVVALKPGKAGSRTWEDNSFTPDASSPVADENSLYVATGYGAVACYNAENGDTLWTHYFPEPFYASPVIADGKVYFLDRTGTMHIVNTGETFNLVSESPLGERSDCTPAFSEREIFIRTTENLFCISGQ